MKPELTFEGSPRFTGGRPGPRYPPGQPESCGRRQTRSTKIGAGKLAPWNLGRGKRQQGEERDLEPDSDANS
jgi:hypothetical protein